MTAWAHPDDGRRGESPDALFLRWRDGGDAEALGRLFDRTARDLFRIAATLVADAATAEDAVQETYLAAIEFAPRWDPSRPVVPWLVGILRHKVEGLRRAHGRRPAADRLPAHLPALDPAGVAELREDAERVRAAMDALPEPLRQTALLRWRHGLDASEIAHLTRTTPGAVRVRLHRALARLRQRVRDGFALAFLGRALRESRGLDDVRRTVLRRAQAAAPASVGAAAIWGGLLVGKKAVAAACVVLAAAVGTWWAAASWTTDAGDVASARDGPVAGAEAPRDRAASSEAAPGDSEAAPEQKPPRETGPAITGRVVDADGDPVAGAKVAAFVGADDRLPDLVALGADTEGAVTATSGPDGAFRLAVADDVARDLVASAAGHAPAVRLRTTAGDVGDLRLGAETFLTGRVRSEDGKPLAGAAVEIVRLVGAAVDRVTTTSGADGRFRLAGAGSRFLTVRADGFAPLQTEFRAERGAAPLEILLFRGVPLEVQVVDIETEQPIEGADVRYGLVAAPFRLDDGRIVPHPCADLGRGTTDADGRVVFEHAPTERGTSSIFVRAWKPGLTASAGQVDEHGETGRMTKRLGMWHVAAIRGRVVDAAGSPVAGCTIQVVRSSWFPSPFGDVPWGGVVRTGADGRFECACVDGGTGAVWKGGIDLMPPLGDAVSGVGFSTRDRRVLIYDSVAGRCHDFGDIVLGAPRPLARATVVVRDESGAPVGGARVETWDALGREHWTDRDGRVSVAWSSDPTLRPPGSPAPADGADERHGARIVAEGFAPLPVELTASAASPGQAVVLRRGVRLAGRVLLPSGGAASGAWVGIEWGSRAAPAWLTTTADETGRFVFDHAPSEPVRLRARLEGLPAPNPTETVRENVRPGAEDVEIVLASDPGPTGTVEGVVLDARTRLPVVGASVEIGSAPCPVTSVTAAVPTGGFRLAGVPAGTWTLRASSPGRLAEDVRVTVAAGTTVRAEVPLSRGAVVRGSVRFPEGVHVKSPRVDLRRIDLDAGAPAPPPGGSFSWIDGLDSFRVAGVRPGTYGMIVNADAGRGPEWLHADPVVVRNADDPVEVDVRLAEVGRATVRIDAPEAPAPLSDEQVESLVESQLPAGATVDLVDSAGRRAAQERGVFRGNACGFLALSGRYAAVLYVDGREVRRVAVEIRTGETAEATIGAE